MENASKALIIAGAILLSILIIAIGMYIYNSSRNSISGAVTQISQQEIDAFNQPWEMYEGKQTGANVRALISRLNTNATENSEEETKLPDLYYEAASGVTAGSGTKVTSTVENPKGDNNTAFNTARTKIESSHMYGITLVTHAQTGLISGVIITYDPETDATEGSYASIYNEFAGIE